MVEALQGDQDLHLRRCSVCERAGQYRCYENGTVVNREKVESFRRLVGRFLEELGK